MTTSYDIQAYRAPVPPDVRLDDVGAVCPVDDMILLSELGGWCCPQCRAWWDGRGRAGIWLADDRATTAPVDDQQDVHPRPSFRYRVRLAWGASHWADETAPCRRCGTPTQGRDRQDHAIHQSCAEDELASEIAGRLSARMVDERARPSAGYRHPGGAR